jgi:hypothetical protein
MLRRQAELEAIKILDSERVRALAATASPSRAQLAVVDGLAERSRRHVAVHRSLPGCAEGARDLQSAVAEPLRHVVELVHQGTERVALGRGRQSLDQWGGQACNPFPLDPGDALLERLQGERHPFSAPVLIVLPPADVGDEVVGARALIDGTGAPIARCRVRGKRRRDGGHGPPLHRSIALLGTVGRFSWGLHHQRRGRGPEGDEASHSRTAGP